MSFRARTRIATSLVTLVAVGFAIWNATREPEPDPMTEPIPQGIDGIIYFNSARGQYNVRLRGGGAQTKLPVTSTEDGQRAWKFEPRGWWVETKDD